MANLELSTSTKRRPSVKGAALVGVIFALPRIYKHITGGPEVLSAALDAARNLMPDALYVYYLPEPGNTLNLSAAQTILADLHLAI